MANNVNNGITGVIDIPGALRSRGAADGNLVGGVVAYAGDIYDVTLGKNLADVNSDLTEALSEVGNDVNTVQNSISNLSTIATTGSFNDLVDNPLDITNTSSGHYVKIGVESSDNKPWSLAVGAGSRSLSASNSIALGVGCKSDIDQVVVGRYNDSATGPFIVGCGKSDSWKNGLVVGNDGKVYIYGVNGYQGNYYIGSHYPDYSLTTFVNNLDSRTTSLLNTINASSTAWSNLAPATNVTLAAITGLNATNAQDAFSEINTAIAPLRTGGISSTLVSDTNFNTTLDQINLSVPYNISAANSSAEYTDLEDALGSNGSNIPQNLRVGGLTVKFVNSDTEEYEQWRLKSSSWSTNTSNWTNSITTRAEGIYWGSDKLTSKINELNDDKSLVGNTNASALESKINALISCINSLVNKVVFYTGTPFALPQELNSQLNLSRYSYSDTTANTALLGSAICGQALCGNN